jgi:hypothetical protein
VPIMIESLFEVDARLQAGDRVKSTIASGGE